MLGVCSEGSRWCRCIVGAAGSVIRTAWYVVCCMCSGEGSVAFVVVVKGASIGVVLMCFSRLVRRLTVAMLLPQSLPFLFAGCGTISKEVNVAASPTFYFLVFGDLGGNVGVMWRFGMYCFLSSITFTVARMKEKEAVLSVFSSNGCFDCIAGRFA
jgi:hypothetical protein